MENEQKEEQGYVPRPRRQVWGARLLLVIFLAAIAIYYLCIAKGGV